MAACDNLYGNREEWKELYDFLIETHPDYINDYMRDQPEDDEENRICYIADIQEWLYENCPLTWVKERLKENFSIQKFILGKAHHERKYWKNMEWTKWTKETLPPACQKVIIYYQSGLMGITEFFKSCERREDYIKGMIWNEENRDADLGIIGNMIRELDSDPIVAWMNAPEAYRE